MREGEAAGDLEGGGEVALEVGESLQEAAVEVVVILGVEHLVIGLRGTVEAVEKSQRVNHIERREGHAPMWDEVFRVVGGVEARAPAGEVRRLGGELMQRIGVGAAVAVVEEAAEEAVLEA